MCAVNVADFQDHLISLCALLFEDFIMLMLEHVNVILTDTCIL